MFKNMKNTKIKDIKCLIDKIDLTTVLYKIGEINSRERELAIEHYIEEFKFK